MGPRNSGFLPPFVSPPPPPPFCKGIWSYEYGHAYYRVHRPPPVPPPPTRGFLLFSVDFQAFHEGLTRLDRATVLPLDVRDDFILPDAVAGAEDMLERPIDMVFNCAGVSTTVGKDAVEGSSSAAGALDVVEVRLVGFFFLGRGVCVIGFSVFSVFRRFLVVLLLFFCFCVFCRLVLLPF